MSGQYEKSYQVLTKSINRLPNAQTFNNIGNIYLVKNQVDSAVVHYRRARELDPDDGGIFVNMGTALLALGDTLNADALYSQARSKYTDNLCQLLFSQQP